MTSESSSDTSNMVADISTDHNTDIAIGTRIESSGDTGTVKYIGPVDNYPGIWLGIDWDNATRGKHDGTVKGVQYFKAREANSGSFVRREKVNFGQSLIDAIVSRYGYETDENVLELNRRKLTNLQKSINAPFIKLVGFDKISSKQSDYETLEILSVRLQNVYSIGSRNELKRLCPNVREIDLSKNLLKSWNQIFNVCLQLNNLTWLNVSENLLVFPEDFDNFPHTFPNVKTLICGHMQLNWSDIWKLSKIFPGIKELRAQYNIISDITMLPDHNFRNLRTLDLEGNSIANWAEILKLSVIENLNYLILDNMGLERIYFDNEKVYFRNLNRISISENNIREWRSISELNKLSALEDLRFRKNPVFDTEKLEMCDQIIIAKLRKLKILNGGHIESGERRGAEYDYIKKYGLDWLKVRNTEQKRIFMEEHNRYVELIEKYGCPEESDFKVQQNIIQSSLITVNLLYEGRSVAKKIPPTMLIQKLITLVHKLYKLSDRPILKYVSNKDNDIEILLDDEMKEIGFYSIQENDTILVTT